MRIVVVDPSGFTLPYDDRLCDALGRRGHEVRLWSRPLREGEITPRGAYTYEACFYRTAERLRSRFGPVWVWQVLKGLEYIRDLWVGVRALRRWRPDVLHFQWLPLPIVDGRYLGAFRRVAPLVLTVHDTCPFRGSPTSRVQLWGWRAVLRAFDAYIVHTEFSRTRLLRLGVPAERIAVIPMGGFGERRAGLRDVSVGGGQVVLFFGTIKPYKGVDVLLRALARLPADLRRCTRLYIAGLPRMDVRPLRRLAREVGVEAAVVWDLRFIPEDDWQGLIEAADVVVFPYRDADASAALMTALAFGKPVVATRVGGIPEILQDGVHGYLVEPDDVEGLAEALAAILSNADLRRRMSEAVRVLAASLPSWDTVAERTLRVYRSCDS